MLLSALAKLCGERCWHQLSNKLGCSTWTLFTKQISEVKYSFDASTQIHLYISSLTLLSSITFRMIYKTIEYSIPFTWLHTDDPGSTSDSGVNVLFFGQGMSVTYHEIS